MDYCGTTVGLVVRLCGKIVGLLYVELYCEYYGTSGWLVVRLVAGLLKEWLLLLLLQRSAMHTTTNYTDRTSRRKHYTKTVIIAVLLRKRGNVPNGSIRVHMPSK